MQKVVLALVAAMAAATPVTAETYRLIHAVGAVEHEVARDLSRSDCEALKTDRKEIAIALGTHSEQFGIGSITCLPESVFDN